MALLLAFGKFKEVACDGRGGGCADAPPLCIAAAKDVVKMVVLAACNTNEFAKAAGSLRLPVMDDTYALRGQAECFQRSIAQIPKQFMSTIYSLYILVYITFYTLLYIVFCILHPIL